MPCLRPIREPSSPRRRFQRPSASTCNSANTFRPRGFSPPRRFAPVPGSHILQHDTEQGSLCFSAEPPVSQGRNLVNRRLAHPHSAVHTPRRIPLASSRTVSPRPLPLSSFAYASGLPTPPSLPSFPDTDKDTRRHLPKSHVQRTPLWAASSLRNERPKTSLHSTTAARRSAEAYRTNTEMLVFPGRLQGFTPPTSPYCVDCFQYRHSLSFHGLCSPPRRCSLRFVPATSRRQGRTTQPKLLALHCIPPLVSRISQQANQPVCPRSLFESAVFHRLKLPTRDNSSPLHGLLGVFDVKDRFQPRPREASAEALYRSASGLARVSPC